MRWNRLTEAVILVAKSSSLDRSIRSYSLFYINFKNCLG